MTIKVESMAKFEKWSVVDMKFYDLQPEEVLLYESGSVSFDKKIKGKLLLTNQNTVCVIEKHKMFSKKTFDVQAYPVEDIKIYNGLPQIKQKGDVVTVYLRSDELTVEFTSIVEATKFANSIIKLMTGKSMLQRGADKVKDALDLVSDTIGIDPRAVAKDVMENGAIGAILKIGKLPKRK